MMDLGSTRFVHGIRHLVPRNAVAGELYAAAMLARATAKRLRGGRADVLHPLLRAWRVSAGHRPFGGVAIRWAEHVLRDATVRNGRLQPLAHNEILREFVRSPQADRIRHFFAPLPLEHRVRIRGPLPPEDAERQGDLIILKEPVPGTGERGVILIKYSETAEMLAALFAIERMTEQYAFVIEPSWWGYADTRFLLYVGSDARVLIQAPAAGDREFIDGLGINLRAIEIGAGDWVDPTAFTPVADGIRRWDVAMVSSWSRNKRHDVLFRALRELRDQGDVLTAALVGYPIDIRLSDVQAIAARHGVLEQCTFFENIPHEQVNEVVGRSRVSVLLSRQEGANKAIYESLFADTPVLVTAGHLGVNTRHVSAAGDFFRPGELPAKLRAFARGEAVRGARAWAVDQTGALRSTRVLNQELKQMALAAGEPWTTDIVPKKNAPGLRYLEPGRYRDFAGAYTRLEHFLR